MLGQEHRTKQRPAQNLAKRNRSVQNRSSRVYSAQLQEVNDLGPFVLPSRPPRSMPNARTYEHALNKAHLGPVAGVDEAGRGACCGPVAIAACILPDRPLPELEGLTDSKKLSPRRREVLFPLIKKHATAWSVLLVPAAEVDTRGIQEVNVGGMRRAVAQLVTRPGYVLTDAMYVPGLTQPHLPMIGGDSAARCIAAASVLAKVTRDHYMVELDRQYPGYGLANHKGYGTASHMAAVRLHGPTPEHRYTYQNVAVAAAEFQAHHGRPV